MSDITSADDPPGKRGCGIVRWFSRPKGFGFIDDADGNGDVYVHFDQVRAAGLRELRLGDHVTYEYARGSKGRMVTRMLSID